MNNFPRFIYYFFILTITAASAQHVLFITGEESHTWGQHERRATSIILAAALENVDPEISTEHVFVATEGWPTQSQIDTADCIFINTYGYSKHIVNSDTKMSQLEAHMNLGKGFASMSWSLAVNGSLANRWKNLIGANWSGSNRVATFNTESLYKPEVESHPVMNGLPDYHLNDEYFFNFDKSTLGTISPILVHQGQNAAFSYDRSIRGNDATDELIANGHEFLGSWCFRRAAGGRAFGHAGGRYYFNLAKDSFRTNLLNGIMWTMKKNIPASGYRSLTPSASTMLLNLPSHTYRSSLTDLQRSLNYNQENAAEWRDDNNPNQGINIVRKPSNIPSTFSSAAPALSLNLNSPDGPSNCALFNEEVVFTKTQLSSDYITEGAAIADMDGDGNNDLIAGPLWWKGPELTQGHSYKPVVHTKYLHPDGSPISLREAPNGALSLYTTDFFVFPTDLDGNQWIDLITVARQGEAGKWYRDPAQNPLPPINTTVEKENFQYQNQVNCESPLLVDVIGDSSKELISFNNNRVTITTPANSTDAWTKRTISEANSGRYRRGHGLGAGDLNADGLVDIIVNHGWYQQPVDINSQEIWTFHAYSFANSAAQIQVFDVDGDGDNDLVTALRAHGYGMAWYEQIVDASTTSGISFTKHLIMPENAISSSEESPTGISFSQLHCMESADIDGDGIKDIITGKCHLAHNASQGDPDPLGDPVLYWFKTQRNADSSVNFEANLIDNDSGVGRQISVADLNNDGRLDIATGNKKGVYAFIQE
ncbi:MAG: ThuA domain-containing protein [Akkermansiaceae bacterium]